MIMRHDKYKNPGILKHECQIQTTLTPSINNKTLQETLKTTLMYQNIGLEGNKQPKLLTLVYIGLVSLFGLSGGDISPSQTGALLSCSSLPPLTLLPSLFLKCLPTPLSLSPLISVYIVLLNLTDVASVTSICLSVRQAAVPWHWDSSRGGGGRPGVGVKRARRI